MNDDAGTTSQPEASATPKSWASRHPKVMILLIAGVFYIILFGMCAFVFVLILRG
jgi:hypothetical protein